jgi:drug efflux transport system permease protein
MLERIIVILRKEFAQVLREPRMRVLLFVPPIVQLIVFGFAVNLDVDRARIAWMDMDGTPASRALHDRFSGSGRFQIVATPTSEEQVQRVLDRSEAQAVVRILPGFARDLDRARPTQVQVLVDGTNSNTASLVSSYAGTVIAEFSAEAMQRRLPPSSTAPEVVARTRVWFNPDLYSRNYFVPGVIANILMLVTLMLTALGIVREKEIGTMEQLMVTPMRPFELMLGKTLPFAIIGLLDVCLITGVALLVFHIPLRGSFLLLLACAALFLLTNLGAGLFLSTISQTQQQAMMMSFFYTTPAFMLSGFAFPVRNMPVAVQWLTYLNPIRYFIEIVRGIFLKGSGITVLWPQMLCLAVYGTAILTFSALRFHKKLD